MLSLTSYYFARLAEFPRNIQPDQLDFDFEWEKIAEFEKTCGVVSIQGLFKDKQLYLLEMELVSGSGGLPYGNCIAMWINGDSNAANYRRSTLYCVNGTSYILTNWSGITWPNGTTTYYGPGCCAFFASFPARAYLRALLVSGDEDKYSEVFVVAASSNSTYTTFSVSTLVREVKEAISSVGLAGNPSAVYKFRLYTQAL